MVAIFGTYFLFYMINNETIEDRVENEYLKYQN